MDNPEKLATLGTQDTGQKQNKNKNKAIKHITTQNRKLKR